MKSSNLSVLVVAHDCPYPANHGGRVDMWSRLQQLNAKGVQIVLLSWSNSPPSRDEAVVIQKYVLAHMHHQVTFKSRIAAFGHPLLPSGVATHVLSASELAEARIESESVDAVILDGIYGFAPALALSEILRKPLIYRAHNVEWKHMGDQVHSSTGIGKLRYMLDSVRMRRIEYVLRHKAAAICEISDEDDLYWRTRGYASQTVVRPYVNVADSCRWTSSRDIQFDIAFCGNLHNANNLEGLRWFVEYVAPLLPIETSIVFAGSQPTEEVLQLAESSPRNVRVIPDPGNMEDIYAISRVLINPSRRASGVNLKSVGMLASGLPFVCTPSAMRGIPDQLRLFVNVRDRAQDFASSLDQAIQDNRGYSVKQCEMTREFFGESQVEGFLKLISDSL